MHLVDPEHWDIPRPHVLWPHRRDVVLHPPNIRHAWCKRARAGYDLLGGRDPRELCRHVGEAGVGQPSVVLILRLPHRRNEASSTGELGEGRVVNREGAVDQARDDVPAPVSGGREAVRDGNSTHPTCHVRGMENRQDGKEA